VKGFIVTGSAIVAVCAVVTGPLHPGAVAVMIVVPLHPALYVTVPVDESIVFPPAILAASRL
jgi:hypothetical protein